MFLSMLILHYDFTIRQTPSKVCTLTHQNALKEAIKFAKQREKFSSFVRKERQKSNNRILYVN